MTTDDVQGLIRKTITERERKAEENRKQFPHAAELADLLAEFNPKLIYAEQNGRSIGKKPDDSQSLDGDRLLAMIDSTNRTMNAMNKRRK